MTASSRTRSFRPAGDGTPGTAGFRMIPQPPGRPGLGRVAAIVGFMDKRPLTPPAHPKAVGP
jgi:hypothetical protein